MWITCLNSCSSENNLNKTLKEVNISRIAMRMGLLDEHWPCCRAVKPSSSHQQQESPRLILQHPMAPIFVLPALLSLSQLTSRYCGCEQVDLDFAEYRFTRWKLTTSLNSTVKQAGSPWRTCNSRYSHFFHSRLLDPKPAKKVSKSINWLQSCARNY